MASQRTNAGEQGRTFIKANDRKPARGALPFTLRGPSVVWSLSTVVRGATEPLYNKFSLVATSFIANSIGVDGCTAAASDRADRGTLPATD